MDVMEKSKNDQRLIDADALCRKFEGEPWYDNADLDEIALPLVDDAPTIDAVEVVRCRECKKHCEANGKHYCKFWRMYCPDDSDFFCKAGERKEGAD